MTPHQAYTFSQKWLESWNSRDIEKIVEHYSDDFSITTPLALKLIPECGGFIKGKSHIREYWLIALERIPGLRFEIIDVLQGVDGLLIYYANLATGKKAAEWMHFDASGKVDNVIVYYSEYNQSTQDEV